MAYDELLADRIRALLLGVPHLTERRMFGGIAFMVQGNMACGIARDHLLARVGADEYEAALAEPDAEEMQFTGRPMRGFVQVDLAALEDDDRLDEWVRRCVDFAMSLPPK